MYEIRKYAHASRAVSNVLVTVAMSVSSIVWQESVCAEFQFRMEDVSAYTWFELKNAGKTRQNRLELPARFRLKYRLLN